MSTPRSYTPTPKAQVAALKGYRALRAKMAAKLGALMGDSEEGGAK